MISTQISQFCLCLMFAAFLLSKQIIYAQRFLTPANHAAKYGNLSGSIDFVWTYSTPGVPRTAVHCEVRLTNVLYKRAGGSAAIQGRFVGRATAIDDTARSPYRIGFRLNNLAFSDASSYHCSMSYDGGPLIRSREYRFRIYEGPNFVNCLLHGLFIPISGSSYFYVRENGTLSSTCYVYGVPVPSLDCRTYDSAGTQQAALPLVRRNYTSSPSANRMVFRNIQRAVARVRCIADGEAIRRSTEKMIRVDYLPSAPHSITLLESTTASIKIGWTAPQYPGVTRITDYYMVLLHPNSTTTATNYTVSSWTPVLQYTFRNLSRNLKYGIRISAYNAIGRGQQSSLAEFQTINRKSVTSSGTDNCLSAALYAGIILAYCLRCFMNEHGVLRCEETQRVSGMHGF